MRWENLRELEWWVWGVAALVLIVGADVVMGSSLNLTGRVCGHNYVPAYTTVATYCDKSGCHTTTSYHPAQYLVHVAIEDDTVTCDQRKFFSLGEGTDVKLKRWRGRWTGINYHSWITEARTW